MIAGPEVHAGQKPARYYMDLAESLGVEDRCRWRIGYVPEDEIGELFGMSDVVLLTYSSKFRSASAVLNVAARFRVLSLASAGQSNLCSMVRMYELGLVIEPDSLAEVISGFRKFRASTFRPRWVDYEHENSWDKNARLVLEKMSEFPPTMTQRSLMV
jgi:hypothetical protein